jgi:hypothetical protein
VTQRLVVVQVIVSILCPAGGQANPWELTRNRAARVWVAVVRNGERIAPGGDAGALGAPLAGIGLAFKKKGADIQVNRSPCPLKQTGSSQCRFRIDQRAPQCQVTGISAGGSAAISGRLYKGSTICKVIQGAEF